MIIALSQSIVCSLITANYGERQIYCVKLVATSGLTVPPFTDDYWSAEVFRATFCQIPLFTAGKLLQFSGISFLCKLIGYLLFEY